MNNIAPVLIIFFNRPDTLAQVFEQVKIAKPSKIYLAQDGARIGNDNDLHNIMECREIVEDIDWDCEVHKKYEVNNLGCGRGPEAAINWFFQNEESGIILEDDCVASQSFFLFCSEMLRKYDDDDRIFMITGCNCELETKKLSASYSFGYAGTNWGWATWKRNWSKLDYSCSWIKNKYVRENLKHIISSISKNACRREIALFEKTNRLVEDNINISYWDVQFQALRYINHQLSIIPSKNLITNIGFGPTSTHAKNRKVPDTLNEKVGKINAAYNQRFELEYPLIHPNNIIENVDYDKKVYNYLYPNIAKRFAMRVSSLFVRIRNIFGK